MTKEDEYRLRKIIQEELRSFLSEALLTEMAFDMSKYKDQIRHHIQQIAINWCLVRYTSYDNRFDKLKKHWSSELISHLSLISSMKLKKNNNMSTKEKALYSVWNEFEFDTNEQSIDMAVAPKFETEGIDTFSEEYINTINDFKNASKDIISIILSGSRKTIQEYVFSI